MPTAIRHILIVVEVNISQIEIPYIFIFSTVFEYLNANGDLQISKLAVTCQTNGDCPEEYPKCKHRKCGKNFANNILWQILILHYSSLFWSYASEIYFNVTKFQMLYTFQGNVTMMMIVLAPRTQRALVVASVVNSCRNYVP